MSTRIQPTVQQLLRRSYLSTPPQIRKMSSQNQHGQGASHATDPNASKVPAGIQKAAPEGLERNLPESVHPTGDKSQSTSKTHALNDGQDSIVPKKIQEIVPEGLERALPNAIHNTGPKK